ncbi:unnamed protein product [Adineta steineri]|uniref:Caspase family p20 domain-containing protein n=1 Tax=Adineta steineri TaxID=433720 RepID=A0A819P229_9BILA|nr:unnamed protein product [Adineta steineri]
MIQRYLSFELILGSPRNFTETSTSLKGKKSCDTATLDSLIVPFQSPFWLNNKNWFVTCDYIPLAMKTILYTTPICTEVEVQAESPVFEVSSTKPNCRLILHRNYNMIYNIENETLTTVDLSRNEIGDIGAQYLAATLQNHQTLATLDLSHNRIGNKGALYLYDALKENKTLIKLNLKGNPGRYCTTVSAAIQIYNDKTITKMDLHEKSIDDIRMKFLADAVYNNEVTSFLICSIDDHGFIVTLIKLNLKGNPGSYCTVVSAAIQIRNNKVLTILELSHNRIGNNGAQYLYDAFKENKTLIKLNLEGNPGSYCATVSAAIQIRDNKTLIKLNLKGNPGRYCTTVSAAIQIYNDKTISKMDLHGKSIDDIAMKFLTDAVYNNETITELNLEQNKISDIGIQYLADALQNNKVIINLRYIGVKYLNGLLQTNQVITMMDLLGNHIEDTGTQYLANALQNNATITELNLSRNEISDIGVQYLADMLRNNTTLVTLDLSNNAIGDIGAQELFNSLETNKTIMKVRLDYNKSKYCEAIGIAIGIQNDKTLTSIDLRWHQYGDNEIKLLANELYKNKTITYMNLRENKISDTGIKYLANALKNNKVLTILELSYNQISNNGLQCLDDALKENKTLIKLNLEGNSGSYYTTVSAAIQIRNDKITVPGFSTSNNSIHTKRALLIGNNKYKKNSQLQYCINDAEDLANKLYKIDFEITIGTNLTYEQMNRIIETFNDKINPGDLVLFFFAGHGCQWSHLNFLMPIDDDRIKTNTDLEYRAINAQVTLEKIMDYRPSAAIFLLDCYRNSFVCESSNFNGLSSMRPIGHSFIGFAMTANKVALDKSKNGRNSLFTSHLLQHIDQPNFTIGEIMYGVCNGMMNETNNDQCPFRVSSLRRKVYLNQQFPIGQSIPLNHFNINTKWRRHGITMAGGNGYGNQLNQLSQPRGIYVDDDHQTVYIADWLNHRIVVWKYRAKSGQVVAGGNGYGNRSDQLYFPTDVIVDKKNNSLIICDQGNRRVVRWSRQNSTIGETIISDIDCYGLTMDKNGDLYVSDYMKNEVRRWKQEEKEEIIVAGGNGKGNHLNQLNCPTYIFVDEDHSIYVSDCDNHRVMKWTKRAKGVVVAGGNGQGNSLTQLSYPRGVAVDQLGNVYVADYDNHRVMRWCEGSKEGSIVVGGNGKGEQSNQFNCPTGLSFDVQGNLYVVDHGNARIQKFHIDLN